MDCATVHISFKYIRYSESDGIIELDVEPLVTNQFIVYVPSEDDWNKKYGEWAMGRCKEIIDKIFKCIKEPQYWKIEEI